MKSAKDIIIDKKKQLIVSAELAAEEINDWQVIQAYLKERFGTILLSEKQTEKLARYQYIYNQLSTGRYTDSEVSEQVQRFYGIEDRQAIRDIHDAKEIFCTVFNLNKEFELKVQLEVNRLMLQKCDVAQDYRAYANIEKNRVQLIKLIKEAEDDRAANFVPHSNQIVFDPSLTGVGDIDHEDLAKLVADIEKQYGGHIPGIEHIYQDAEIISEDNGDA